MTIMVSIASAIAFTVALPMLIDERSAGRAVPEARHQVPRAGRGLRRQVVAGVPKIMKPKTVHAGLAACLVPAPVEVIPARGGAFRPDEDTPGGAGLSADLHVRVDHWGAGRNGDGALACFALERVVDRCPPVSSATERRTRIMP
ncbi:hypothetical protein OG539_16790 [Actinacidiphila glaucinigra]|uniref:hypothetical protein n=1 Tax=Actinacidiphila glaucinigra TaxID=235986 RepID=UPI003244F0EA